MKKLFSIATVVLLLFCLALPAFAADDDSYPKTYPTISGVKSTHRVVVYDETNDRYLLYLLAGIVQHCRFQVEVNSNGTYQIVGSGSGNVTFKSYQYKPGVDEFWVEINRADFTSPSAVSIPSTSFNEIKYTNFVINTTTGESFFPQPGADLLGTVTCLIRRTVLTLNPTLTRTVSILVLCGVGCLTLLISCALLPKVLRRYLH